MRLYLDDDSAKSSLVRLLSGAGYHVTIPADVGLTGASDPRHMRHAVEQQFVLLTRNHDDFEELHLLLRSARGTHAGILVIRSDNDPSRDMKDRDILRALGNLQAAGVPIADEFHILNHWR